MFNIVCLISIAVNCGFKSIDCLVKSNVRGNIIQQTKNTYLVNFSEGLKLKENFSGNADDYKEIIVDSKQCVELKE